VAKALKTVAKNAIIAGPAANTLPIEVTVKATPQRSSDSTDKSNFNAGE
jgi:hypothetical protein